jgi:hypothetical protein
VRDAAEEGEGVLMQGNPGRQALVEDEFERVYVQAQAPARCR